MSIIRTQKSIIRKQAKLDRKIARQEKRVARYINRLSTKLNDDLKPAYDTVITAMTNAHLINQSDLCISNHNCVSRIDPVTGELRDYLVHFPEYDTIWRIKKYLEAYLITNRDVLEETKICELEELINFLP